MCTHVAFFCSLLVSQAPATLDNNVSDGFSDMSSLTADEEEEAEEEDIMIPKPTGEVGRPSRGGYNLDHVLLERWESARVTAFRVRFLECLPSIRVDICCRIT